MRAQTWLRLRGPARTLSGPLFLAAAALALGGCGSAPNDIPFSIPSMQTDAAASNATVLEAGPQTSNDALLWPPLSWPPEAAPSTDALACAETRVQAQPLPLDMLWLVDSSGSMSDLIAPGLSKWSAVASALTNFARDPASSGIGIGVQYFPENLPGVPATCASSGVCGSSGPCLLAVCDDGSGVPCASDADCNPGSACVPVGACQNDANELCPTPGVPCGFDSNGFDLGTCQALTVSTCAAGDSCAPADYAVPAVGIGPLPAIAPAIASSLGARTPQGATPTAAALQGIVDGARSYARAHPGHALVLVLATDGVPDELADPSTGLCVPTDVATAEAAVTGVVSAAAAATPPLPTFAIGVFAPADVVSGTATLDAIAAAGGSGQPFIIQTPGFDGGAPNVEGQLAAAMNQIRSAALPCDYAVPVPEAGTPDYAKLNVRYTAGDGAVSDLPYVAASAACAGGGGWYYDVDPLDPLDSTAGGVPRSIETCPATCAALHADPLGRVDVVLGCATVVR